jgi:hypothetical protein
MMDGQGDFFSIWPAGNIAPGMEVPLPAARSSSLPSSAPKANSSLPTQTRQQGGMILLTYDNKDGQGQLTTVMRLSQLLVTA